MPSDDRIKKMILAILDEIDIGKYTTDDILWNVEFPKQARQEYLQRLIDIAKMHLKRSN